MRHLSNQQKTLLIRIFWFCGLFLVVSGFIGSWIIPTKLLYGFHFFIYGNLGKMVLIFAILLGLIARSRIAQLSQLPAPRTNVPALVTAALLIPTFFALATRLLEYGSFAQQPALSLLTHIVIVAIPALLGMGIFGARLIRSFAITYRREIGISLLVALLLDVMIFQVWKLWPIFSTGVLLSVKWLLSLTFERVTHIPPYLLAVDGFAVAIEQACSGLDSLFLFTALYVMVMIVDYKRLNIAKLIYTYIPAVLGMYVINILRVYVLMLIGILISPQLAIRLFHTYAGMVLFILYFALFWSIMYKRLLKKKE